MQSRLRLHLATRVALLSIFLGSPVAAAPQSSVEQPTAALPKPWSDAVAQLADKVAASQSPSTPLTLEARNISSISHSDAASILALFQQQLKRHSFRFATASSAKALGQLHLILSESADSYIWVVELPDDSRDENPSAALIVAVPKSRSTDDTPDQSLVLLDEQFIWRQPERFLDFLVQKKPDGTAELLILEKNGIAIHDLADSRSEVSASVRIPITPSPSRDPFAAFNPQDSSVLIGDLRCFDYLDRSQPLHCAKTPDSSIADGAGDTSRSRPSVGAVVSEDCHGKAISLETGDGDWTEPDSVTAYLFKPGPHPHRPENAMHFDGPIISLQAAQDSTAARAVVHNLKTGNYEAYIVTATCSH